MMPSFTLSLNRELAHASRNETGQTIVEYALIIVLFALALLIASPSLAGAVAKVFADTSSLMGYRP
jgi:Flp pilus assembly pilin Flp